MAVHVVLFQPQIPNNTGNIGRLCVGTDCVLHLIKPLGFEITDSQVKRSGLDYWPHLTYHIHESFEDFIKDFNPEQLYLFTAHATKSIWETKFTTKQDVFLIFGREADGLPTSITNAFANKQLFIPMFSDKVRCYNLANAVAMAVMEVKRQFNS